MNGRQNMIDSATEGTCKWLLEHKALIQWTRQNRGLFWIKGKPGSGKSTLLKYALKEVPAIYNTDTIAIYFFFHGRGHELQRTPLGLYRSFLHQILSYVPGALCDMIDHFEKQRKRISQPGEKWKWELQELQEYLELSLARILNSSPVILCVDALDECSEKEAVRLIGYFKRLLESLPLTNFRFSICFSCRHHPVLQPYEELTILLDSENNADIATFVRARFSTSSIDVETQNTVSRRAQGVFMWASLVVERVLEMERHGESKGHIDAAIKQVPPDLNDLYCQLIQNMKDRSLTLKLVQWVCFSTRPLTTDELQWGIAVDPDCTHKSLDRCQQSDDFITNENIDRRLKTLSCGLVEIVASNNTRVA